MKFLEESHRRGSLVVQVAGTRRPVSIMTWARFHQPSTYKDIGHANREEQAVSTRRNTLDRRQNLIS
ncbi:MAG: hypothetical protein WBO88_14610, partial [Candidatus Dechloromonas phosphoritropha]